MKYQVGDKTLLGEIARTGINPKGDTVYIVDLSNDAFDRTVAFEEAIIDKIIIKPKRNIDHLIESWEAGKEYEAASIMADVLNANGSTRRVMEHLMKPYSDPSRYPKLTPEELKAVKWLVEGGYNKLYRGCIHDIENLVVACGATSKDACSLSVGDVPVGDALKHSKWITESPISLRELLAAQEEEHQ